MTSPFFDINFPGAPSFGEEKAVDTPAATPAGEPAPAEHEVEFESADEWAAGRDGFQFNKECYLTVKVKLLKDTARTRVEGDVFVEFDGDQEDLGQVASGNLDADGVARLAVKLWYGSAYYDALAESPEAKCSYVVRNIRHSRGANTLDSGPLEMPRPGAALVELPDTLFVTGGALPCIDEDYVLAGGLVAALIHARDNQSARLTVCGHAERAGEGDPAGLSEARARAVRALLDNDKNAFADIAVARGGANDARAMLMGLSSGYGWPCRPADNTPQALTRALTQFQEAYNETYEGTLTADGATGRDTWEALFTVVRDIAWDQYQRITGATTVPSPAYASDNDGILACGANYPVSAGARGKMRSRGNRRVELRFAGEPSDGEQVASIAMAPVQVVQNVKPFTNMEGFELRCEHERTVQHPAVLEVVPDALTGDKITCRALIASGAASGVHWWADGWSVKRGRGETFSFAVKGFKTPAEQLLPVNGIWAPHFKPHEVALVVADSGGKALRTVVRAYPGTKVEVAIRIGEKLRVFLALVERIQTALARLGAKFPVEFAKDSEVKFSGAYKEDSAGPSVFFAAGLEAKLDPLVKGEWHTPKASVVPVLNAIPSVVRRYAADIYFQFRAKISVKGTFGFSRESPDEWKTRGGLEVSAEGSGGLYAEIANGHVLKAEGRGQTELSAEGRLTPERDPASGDTHLCLSARAGWKGVELKAEFLLFDGWVKCETTMTLVDPVKEWVSQPLRLLTLAKG